MTDGEDERGSKNEELITVRNDLISVLSHDMLNSLSVVKMYAMMMEKEKFNVTTISPDLYSKRVTAIRRITDDMVNLVTTLMDTETIIKGTMPVIVVSEGDLYQDIIRVLEELEPLAAYHGLTLRFTAVTKLGTQYDHDRMRQVLVNLITNAVKFAHHGTAISIEANRLNSHVQVKIHNKGDIIPEELREKIFERYVQSPRNRIAGGRGLGLWITRWIINEHHGRIWVEPEADGNTFIFEMPLVKPAT